MTRTEHGAVTAETAMALPLIALFTVSMAWLVLLGITHVRAVDAARETARSAARGDGDGEAVSLGRRVATSGSAVSVRHRGDLVEVTVRSPVPGPRGLLAAMGGLSVSGQAVAVAEPTS